MIKIFRNIRRKLLHEGKASNYLLYAIGEIALVMIGILLALQVNTWNQNRLDNITEVEYYKRFLDDVLLDEQLIANQVTQTEKRMNSANQLLASLQSGHSDMAKIATEIVNSVSRSDFSLTATQTTYEDIKSSGSVHLIRDDEIKNQLDHYYAFMTALTNTINSNAARLASRMLHKEDVIGTGLAHLASRQGGIDSSVVNITELKNLGRLTDENRLVLMNDAVFYSAITSRNLQHLSALQERVKDMKQILKAKCESSNE